MVDEFGLIQRLCRPLANSSAPVDLGPGDDAALVSVPPGQQLVITTDSLNAGVHFFADGDPSAIGHKSLAVSLSDLAAMGATPRWITLNLSLPKSADFIPAAWIDDFAVGLAGLADQYAVALVGGDLTSGPLAVTVTALGLLPADSAVRRDTARPGDLIAVSGTLGDAAAALQLSQTGQAVPPALLARLLRPQPRVALGQALRAIATSMIDISDGLLADLGHILRASNCGANIAAGSLPLSTTLREQPEFDWRWPLAGGDDYELCFTLAPAQRSRLELLAEKLDIRLSIIGEIVPGSGIRCSAPDGDVMPLESTGWKHF